MSRLISARVEQYADQNRAAARLILDEPQKYGGPAACCVVWAKRVLGVAEMETPTNGAAAALKPTGAHGGPSQTGIRVTEVDR